MKDHQKKLEEVLSLIINEESDEASNLLHQIIVDKARGIHEELVGDDSELEEDEDNTNEEDELDEKIGGHPKASYADEIKADREKIESEEAYEEDDAANDDEGEEGEEGEEFDYDADGDQDEHEEDHEDVEDRVENLEAALAELTAEFEELVGDDIDLSGDLDGDGDDEGGEMDYGDDEGGEMEFDGLGAEEEFESVEEATEFLKKSADTGQKEEGKYSGTGDKSEQAVVNKKSVYSQAARKDYGGEPVDFAGGDEKGMKAKGPSDDTPEDNVDVDLEKAPKAQEKPTGDDKSAQSTLSGVKKNK